MLTAKLSIIWTNDVNIKKKKNGISREKKEKKA